MFDYIKDYILDELKRLFTFNYDTYSYQMRSSEVFYTPKINTEVFGINTLNFDGTKLWNNFILNY